MPIARLPHVELWYEFSGSPIKPVLMLSHALGTDNRLWDKQAAAFREDFRVLRYDTRGHGRSSVPVGEYTLEDLGFDALALLDDLNIERAAFCGISLGGLTALWLAANAPQRVDWIIAANTAARIGSAGSWSARIEQVTNTGMEPLVDATIARWFTGPFLEREPASADYARQVLASTSIAGYTGCCAALRDADLTGRTAQIDLPSLIMTGMHDPVTPPSDALGLHQAIPNSSLVELDAAHLSNIEAADKFNSSVLSWRRRLSQNH